MKKNIMIISVIISIFCVGFTLNIKDWFDKATTIWEGGWWTTKSEQHNNDSYLNIWAGQYKITKDESKNVKFDAMQINFWDNINFKWINVDKKWLFVYRDAKNNEFVLLDFIHYKKIKLPYIFDKDYPYYWDWAVLQTYNTSNTIRMHLHSYSAEGLVLKYNTQNNTYRVIKSKNDRWLIANTKYIATAQWTKICYRKKNMTVWTNTYPFSCIKINYPGWLKTNEWIKMMEWLWNNNILILNEYKDNSDNDHNMLEVFDIENKKIYNTDSWHYVSYFESLNFTYLDRIDESWLHILYWDYLQNDRKILCRRKNWNEDYDCGTIAEKTINKPWQHNTNFWDTTNLDIQLTTTDWNAVDFTTNLWNIYPKFSVTGKIPPIYVPPIVAGESHFGDIANQITKNIPTINTTILGKNVYLYTNKTGSIEEICTNALQNCSNTTIQTIAMQACISNLNEKTPITCNFYNQIFWNCGFSKCGNIWNNIYVSHNHEIIWTEMSWIIINNPKTQPVCSIWRIGTGQACTIPSIGTGAFDALWYVPAMFGYVFCQVWQTADNTVNFWQDILRILGAILVYQPWGENQLEDAGFNLWISTKHWFSIEFQTGSNNQTNKIWSKIMDVKWWILSGIDAILAVSLVMFIFFYLFQKKE